MTPWQNQLTIEESLQDTRFALFLIYRLHVRPLLI